MKNRKIKDLKKNKKQQNLYTKNNNNELNKIEDKKIDNNNKKHNKKVDKNLVVNVCEREFDRNKYGALLRRYFAHRGVHSQYPENSLPAFKEAIDNNFGIELDVHLTKDKKIVVFHDDSLFRMAGVKEYLRYLTVEEIKKYRLNNTEYKIPTLKETLDLVAGKTPILVEIKTEFNTKNVCKHLIDELKDYKGEIFIQSFNPFALRYFYKHAPQYLRGQLSSFFIGKKLGFIKRAIIKKLRLNKYAHVDFVSYNISDLPNRYVNKTNIPILTYTIRTKEEFIKAKTVSNNLIMDNIDLINTK